MVNVIPNSICEVRGVSLLENKTWSSPPIVAQIDKWVHSQMNT
jgi:hypothetical protein